MIISITLDMTYIFNHTPMGNNISFKSNFAAFEQHNYTPQNRTSWNLLN